MVSWHSFKTGISFSCDTPFLKSRIGLPRWMEPLLLLYCNACVIKIWTKMPYIPLFSSLYFPFFFISENLNYLLICVQKKPGSSFSNATLESFPWILSLNIFSIEYHYLCIMVLAPKNNGRNYIEGSRMSLQMNSNFFILNKIVGLLDIFQFHLKKFPFASMLIDFGKEPYQSSLFYKKIQNYKYDGGGSWKSYVHYKFWNRFPEKYYM